VEQLGAGSPAQGTIAMTKATTARDPDIRGEGDQPIVAATMRDAEPAIRRTDESGHRRGQANVRRIVPGTQVADPDRRGFLDAGLRKRFRSDKTSPSFTS
jgi:hypothetical protein